MNFHRTSYNFREQFCSSLFFQFSLHTHLLFEIFHYSLPGPNFNLNFSSLANILTNNTKKESFKNVEYKKMKKHAIWGLCFRFLALQFSKFTISLLFCACLCVFSARFHLNFGLSMYPILLHYWFALKSIHHFICYCFAMSTSAIFWVLLFCCFFFVVFIYSSAFLGSFCGACFYFPLISCLSLLESPSSHVSFQFSFGLAFLISFSYFLLCLGSYTWVLVIGCDWWCYEV